MGGLISFLCAVGALAREGLLYVRRGGPRPRSA
jgi:hypothetical protein